MDTGRWAVLASDAAVGVLDASGTVFFASSALRLAFSCISFCLAGSFAMMGTRSDGTGVLSLKLSANFFRSFSLTSLSFFILAERNWSTFLLC